MHNKILIDIRNIPWLSIHVDTYSPKDLHLAILDLATLPEGLASAGRGNILLRGPGS